MKAPTSDPLAPGDPLTRKLTQWAPLSPDEVAVLRDFGNRYGA